MDYVYPQDNESLLYMPIKSAILPISCLSYCQKLGSLAVKSPGLMSIRKFKTLFKAYDKHVERRKIQDTNVLTLVVIDEGVCRSFDIRVGGSVRRGGNLRNGSGQTTAHLAPPESTRSHRHRHV